ncbi:hypothetical protein [Marilutibacter chinensis]|uniref:Uncharacterized protein n=1 Tax=Marilutibacter chinensis TaxID=2912247 RepID=A0ABS9HNG9_9GAMM|nr:hypothetical protein [Lysobacter chinensis]MCF7220544.1 hypothetical protein [Lysobacter chinensis]
MFLLSRQLHADGDPNAPFRRYVEYLEQNRPRFPAAAYELAASGLLFDATDPNCPHDSWLEWARFEEPSEGERREFRSLSLRVRLLGAYHDRYIELFYPEVFSYTLNNPRSGAGHFDWRYSEVRLSDAGNVIHEIEWAGAPGLHAHWLIEASDVQMRTLPLESA